MKKIVLASVSALALLSVAACSDTGTTDTTTTESTGTATTGTPPEPAQADQTAPVTPPAGGAAAPAQ